jgi:hypothetical protein
MAFVDEMRRNVLFICCCYQQAGVMKWDSCTVMWSVHSWVVRLQPVTLVEEWIKSNMLIIWTRCNDIWRQPGIDKWGEIDIQFHTAMWNKSGGGWNCRYCSTVCNVALYVLLYCCTVCIVVLLYCMYCFIVVLYVLYVLYVMLYCTVCTVLLLYCMYPMYCM